jgi:AGZA family xanthine/uracil permease-like MFS transporter
VVCLAVILASWLGNYRYPGGIPGGLMAIIIGSLIAWVANMLGYPIGGVGPDKVSAALSSFSFHAPLPAIPHIFAGFKYVGIILVTAIPFGIYDLVEAMDNVESAAAAGDHFPTTRVLTADGIISLIGCCMGNPFINAVYIGHPGWKAMGGRMGYSAATGVLMLILTWFGVVALMMAIIPSVALLPILLYIGMLIGAQAFQESPHRHAPAIVLAIVPTIANWGSTQINNALASAGTNAGKVGYDALASNGVLLEGLNVLGSGATLAGIILGSIAVMIIDGKLMKGAYFAFTGAALTFFGLIHSEAGIGVLQTPAVAGAYAIVGIFLAICSRKEQIIAEIEEVVHHGHTSQPAE